MVFPRFYFWRFLGSIIHVSTKISKMSSDKMDNFDFWSIFLRFHVRNNSYLKFWLRQLSVVLVWLSVLLCFGFPQSSCLKSLRNIGEKKWKFSNISHFFQSFCVFGNNISKAFIWVAFHSVSKAHSSASLSYLPLSISQQNCRKNSVKIETFFGI